MRKLLTAVSLLIVGAALFRNGLTQQRQGYYAMDDVLKVAGDHRRQCALDTIAHQVSAENHRTWSVRLGGASEAIAAILGTTVFVGLLSKFGISKEGNFTMPEGVLAGIIYCVVLVLAVAGPVLAAVQKIKHDQEDFTSHLTSTSAYMLIWMRLDMFILRYGKPDSSSNARQPALDELRTILAEYGALAGKSITITPTAYAAADAELKRRGFDFRLEETIRKLP